MKRRVALDALAKAYQKGKGVRLTADEVDELVTGDDALEAVVIATIEEWETGSPRPQQTASLRTLKHKHQPRSEDQI